MRLFIFWLTFLALLLTWPNVVLAALKPDTSFSGPFETLNSRGEREVPNFHIGGDAAIHRHYVRLTPNRPKQIGYIAGTKTLGATEFSLVMKFRLGGTLLGDVLTRPEDEDIHEVEGLVLWIVDSTHPAEEILDYEGHLHRFVGVGVSIQSFQDSQDFPDRMQVISVFHSESLEGDVGWLSQSAVGCETEMWYDESRADFSIDNSSLLKVIFSNNVVRVDVDARNTGEWTPCVTAPVTNLRSGWTRDAMFRISASTSNTAARTHAHDVMALQLYDWAQQIDDESWHRHVASSEQEQILLNLEHELLNIRESIATQLTAVSHQEDLLEEHVHWFEERVANLLAGAYSERLENLEKQKNLNLQQRQASLSKRVHSVENKIRTSLSDRLDALEKTMESRVDASLLARVSALEKLLNQNFDQRISKLEIVFQSTIPTRVNSSVSAYGGPTAFLTRSWRVPFAAFLTVSVLISAVLFLRLNAMAQLLMRRLQRSV